MAITKKQLVDYICVYPYQTNANIIAPLVDELAAGDNPDLSHITATAEKILAGFEGVDKQGNRVNGTCDFNAKLPDVAGAEWASAADIMTGKDAIVLVDGVWTLISGTKE